MAQYDDRRLQLIRQAMSPPLALQGGESGHVGAWRRLFQQLGPLIGESGFAALLGRATRLLTVPHPALRLASPGQSPGVLLDMLETDLAAMSADEALRVNAALLETYTKLLSGLIGEALTIRILDSAWGHAGDTTGAQELK